MGVIEKEPIETHAKRLLAERPYVETSSYREGPLDIPFNPLTFLLLFPFLPFYILMQLFTQMRRGNRVTTVDLVRDERGRVIQVVSMEHDI